MTKPQLLKRNALGIARAMIQPIYFEKQIFIFGGFDKEALRTCEWYLLFTYISLNDITSLHSYEFFLIFSLSSESPFTSRVLQPIQHARFDYSAAIMGGKIYIAGGKNGTASSSLDSVECYDPVDDKWTEISNMNYARTDFALVEFNGMLYAMGHHKSVERYDPVQNVWTVVREKWMILCT